MNESFLIGERFPSVTIGTSGVLALVADLNTEAVFAYVYAFMQQMRVVHAVCDGAAVALGMDLRPSSPSIAITVCSALQVLGYHAEFLGALPTLALALRCLTGGVPGIMVTGSHIPFDRNGIKFYSPVGEILKVDEQVIVTCQVLTAGFDLSPNCPHQVEALNSLCDKPGPLCSGLASNTVKRGMALIDQWMVWNTGVEEAQSQTYMPDADWKRFVCIEPLRVSRPSNLQPCDSFTSTLKAELWLSSDGMGRW